MISLIMKALVFLYTFIFLSIYKRPRVDKRILDEFNDLD